MRARACSARACKMCACVRVQYRASATSPVVVGVGFNMESTDAKAVFAKYLPAVNYDEVFYNRTCLTQTEVNTLFEYSLDTATTAAEVSTVVVKRTTFRPPVCGERWAGSSERCSVLFALKPQTHVVAWR